VDAAVDAADDQGTADGPRQFAVRGGACVCGIAAPPSGGAWLLWIGGALALLAGRRRRA
jgi:MYXO-CTERM domain-containing protein